MMYPNPFQCTVDMCDPLNDHMTPGKWYWYDEAEQLNEEAFDTKEEAEADLKEYMKTL